MLMIECNYRNLVFITFFLQLLASTKSQKPIKTVEIFCFTSSSVFFTPWVWIEIATTREVFLNQLYDSWNLIGWQKLVKLIKVDTTSITSLFCNYLWQTMWILSTSKFLSPTPVKRGRAFGRIWSVLVYSILESNTDQILLKAQPLHRCGT